MGRLTYWNEEYGCWSYHCASGDAAKRLAAYEDTGLESEEVAKLAQAEKDGRLVVLPCKIGDTCYTIGEEDDEPGSEQVMIKGIGALAIGGNSIMFLGHDVIYTTFEAAEAALEEAQNEP